MVERSAAKFCVTQWNESFRSMINTRPQENRGVSRVGFHHPPEIPAPPKKWICYQINPRDNQRFTCTVFVYNQIVKINLLFMSLLVESSKKKLGETRSHPLIAASGAAITN